MFLCRLLEHNVHWRYRSNPMLPKNIVMMILTVIIQTIFIVFILIVIGFVIFVVVIDLITVINNLESIGGDMALGMRRTKKIT